MKRKALISLKWIKEHLVETSIFVVAIVCVGAMIFCVSAALANEGNKINEGVIVDKRYTAAYTSTKTYPVPENTTMPVKEYHPATYHFKIRGDKNGETVEYTFAVTENEYNAYKIGDYYKK